MSCAARGMERQLLRGLPYTRLAEIGVLVFFMPEPVGNVTGAWPMRALFPNLL